MTSTCTIHPERYRKAIQGVLSAVGLPSCEVVVVPSVCEWGESLQVAGPKANPRTLGMAVRAHTDGDGGVDIIVLAEAITQQNRNDRSFAMTLKGFAGQVHRVEDAEAFLEHLVLHEAAHLVLPEGSSESECNRWAFRRLSGCLRADEESGAT